MGKTRISIILSIAGISILLVTAGALARSSTNYAITPDVVASGGGLMSSTNYSLDATSGQTATGSSASAHYRLAGGYWEGGVEAQKIYLPIILRLSR